MQMCSGPRYARLWGQAKVGPKQEFVVYVSATSAVNSDGRNGTAKGTVAERAPESRGVKLERHGPTRTPVNIPLPLNDSTVVPTCYASSEHLRTINSADCNIALYIILTMRETMEPMMWNKDSHLPSEARRHSHGQATVFPHSLAKKM